MVLKDGEINNKRITLRIINKNNRIRNRISINKNRIGIKTILKKLRKNLNSNQIGNKMEVPN